MNDCNVFVFYIAICGGGETQKMRIYKCNNLFAKCKKNRPEHLGCPACNCGGVRFSNYLLYEEKPLSFFLSDDDVKVVRIWISTG